MNHYFSLKDKYIKLDNNASLIIQRLIDNKLKNHSKDELQFQIGTLSLVQFLKVFEFALIGESAYLPLRPYNKMPLTKENLCLFFFFEDRVTENEHLLYKLNYNHFWWGDILDFSLSSDTVDNEKMINKFEIEYNTLINKYSSSIISILLESKNVKNETLVFLLKIFRYLANYKTELPTHFGLTRLEDEKSYNLKLDYEILKKIYSGLVLKDFIDEKITSLKDFIKVFTLPWNTHESKIYLEMDHYQTKLFFDLLSGINGTRINYKDLEIARNIQNRNGFIKASLLSSSAVKNKIDYRSNQRDELIVQVLKKV